jgi:hypothetical protein
VESFNFGELVMCLVVSFVVASLGLLWAWNRMGGDDD